MGPHHFRRVVLARLLLFTVSLAAGVWIALELEGSPVVYADAPPGTYAAAGIDAGVWNDGQAALWDLNLADHFRIFGPPERLKGHRPEQPIRFSHVTHVQRNKMECQFCHWTVTKSSYAAIPEVGTCWGCHEQAVSGPNGAPIIDPARGLSGIGKVDGTEEWQKTEIKKLGEYMANGAPIPWVKVHVMPDHVRFNHKRHIKAGVTCQSCHGQIPEMEVVERVSSMKMGWCVSCHRAQGTSIDCNTCHY